MPTVPAATKRYNKLVKAAIAESKHDPPPPPPDGVKVVLSGFGGLTVDRNGRKLLPQPFVFQCGPLEQYTLAHTFNFGTYDTVDDDQFARRGSRQLSTWQFDTLVMYLGVGSDKSKHYAPGWVPYPRKQPGGQQYYRPEWYVNQLRNLFVAGAPFRYVASFKGSTVIHRTYAVLTAFNEDYKHGEGDAIYLSGVSFMEWRDPRGTPPPRGARLPAHVKFRKSGERYLAYDIKTNRNVKTRSKTAGTTFNDLARDFYGDAGDWRTIAKANKCKGGSGSLPIFTHWYAKSHRKLSSVTIVVPKKPAEKPAKTTKAKK